TVKELRLVLLGKTGDGRSSCGNTILGEEEVFPTGNSPNSETQRCESRSKIINEKEVTVVDTPGFYDTGLPEEELKSEILRCIIECAPGPHAFVTVLRVGRYTEQEKEVVKKITASFGEEALKYAVVLFTHGDDLSEGQTIEDFVKQSTELQELVEKCGGRVHVLDNKYWKQQQDGYRSNRVQVEKLLNTIEEMVRENGGQYYSNEILQEVHRAIEEERENIIRESKEKSQDINMNLIQQQARERVHTKLSVRLVGVTTGALLGALLGGWVCLGGIIAVAGVITLNVAAGVAGAGAVIGAAGGGVVGYDAVEGAETMTEAMKSITKAGFQQEVVKCTARCAPGPHAFIITLKVGRYTAQEARILEEIEELFGEEVLKYSTVLFTNGDQLDDQTIEEFVQQSTALQELVEKCGGRVHVIDNKYWKQQQDGYRSNRVQVEKLLYTIEEMVEKNEGRYYSSEMLPAVNRKKGPGKLIRFFGHVRSMKENIRGKGWRAAAGLVAVLDILRQEMRDKKISPGLLKTDGVSLVSSGKRGTVKELRLVLLGKTGDGKSSCGNTILGEEEVFPTGNSPNSETHKCKPRTKIINQKEVTLVDTPGFYDTDRPEEELKSEILRCIIECAPGPHAFVIVLRVGRYTEQEKEIVKKITASFGEEALKYAVVLFTHGDDLSEGQTIEQFVEQSRELQELVEKCGGRVHMIDNKYWKQQQDGYRSNRVQVEKLLNTIEEMHDIQSLPGSLVKQQPRRMAFEKQIEADKQIQQSLKGGLASPSNSSWASPIVLVRKKDQTYRLCVDYRAPNVHTVKDAYPLPRIQDTLETLSVAKWFSTLDLASGYWQVTLTPRARKSAAFCSRKGLFTWNVMPFGLCNAPATFQRLMDRVLAGLQWETCLVYLDDIIVLGEMSQKCSNTFLRCLTGSAKPT
ncbi:hypothetical protein NFI96_008276, partial [Prochilodus magdalenae]